MGAIKKVGSESFETIRAKFRRFDTDGNHVAMDFINTLDNRGTENEYDWLTEYSDSIAWAERVGLISLDGAIELFERARDQPTDAWQRKILEVRKIVYRVADIVIRGEDPDSVPWATFNRFLGDAMSRLMIVKRADDFVWEFPDLVREPVGFLWPILRSFAELITSSDRDRLKRCADPTCGWIFLDMSKNRSRRWCSMEGCGNRSKVRNYNIRKHQQEGRNE